MITEAATVTFDELELDCGVTLAPVDCAYETYGTLNAAKSNAILVTHSRAMRTRRARAAGGPI